MNSGASEDRFRAGKRLWSAADDAALRRTYPHESTATIATTLRRTVSAVYARAKMLDLEKSEAYLASPAACRLRRGDNIGAAFRFSKGHPPANKGTRRPGWSRGRMAETWFKPGQRSGHAAAHHMPIGSTRLVDGYVYRKLSDTAGVPWTANWKLEHVLVWARMNGPVPPGHALVFRNGDRTDTRIENLELVTRRELMLRNSVHNLPQPLAQAAQLLGALNRQIRKRTRDAEHDRRPA